MSPPRLVELLIVASAGLHLVASAPLVPTPGPAPSPVDRSSTPPTRPIPSSPAKQRAPATRPPGSAEPVHQALEDAHLSGRVWSTHSSPVHAGWVELLVGEQLIAQAELDAQAGFEFETPPGHYRLVARAPGFRPSEVDGLTLWAGEELLGVDIDLMGGLSLRGVVEADRQPLAGVQVAVEGAQYFRRAETDDQGAFELTGLPPGPLVVRAFHPSYGGDEQRAAAGAEVRLALERADQLRGRVLDPLGSPIADAPIYGLERALDEGRPEHDELGALPEGNSGLWLWGCGPMPACLEVANTDEEGRFEIPRGRGAVLLLAAAAGDLRSPIRWVSPDEDEVTLVVRHAATVRLIVAGGPASVRARESADDLSAALAFGELVAGASGEVMLETWPGVPITVRPAPGGQLWPDGPLSPEVTLAPSGHLDEAGE
jgi:hypothetical protein